MLGQSGFYRLLVFFLLIGFLKAIFLQMDYVFPKFGDRELGLHAPVGKLAGINSIVIIILVPDRRRAHATICRLSNGHHRRRHLCRGRFHHGVADGLVPAGGEQRDRTMARSQLPRTDRQHSSVLRHDGACISIVFSIGEAFYSPRVYEYAAAIAPPGQEASYGALAYIPFLVGKLLVGTSGWIAGRVLSGTRAARIPE